MIISNNNSIGSSNSCFNMTNTIDKNQDSQLKSIQKQIENVQKQMQKLSENNDMTLEQKTNKRKELQEKLQELNKQLTQRQLEIQKENREKLTKEKEIKKPVKDNKKESQNLIGTETMQGIINASNSMSEIDTLNSTKTKIEDNSKVVKGEIKLDKGRQVSSEFKENQLNDLDKKIDNIYSDIMKKFSDINDELENSKEINLKEKEIKKDDEKDIAKEEKENGNLKQDEDIYSNVKYVPIDIIL